MNTQSCRNDNIHVCLFQPRNISYFKFLPLLGGHESESVPSALTSFSADWLHIAFPIPHEDLNQQPPVYNQRKILGIYVQFPRSSKNPGDILFCNEPSKCWSRNILFQHLDTHRAGLTRYLSWKVCSQQVLWYANFHAGYDISRFDFDIRPFRWPNKQVEITYALYGIFANFWGSIYFPYHHRPAYQIFISCGSSSPSDCSPSQSSCLFEVGPRKKNDDLSEKSNAWISKNIMKMKRASKSHVVDEKCKDMARDTPIGVKCIYLM